MNKISQWLAALILATAIINTGCSNYSTLLQKIPFYKRTEKTPDLAARQSQQRTFSMIKPEAVRAAQTGQILARIESSGLKIVALKMVQLDRSTAQSLYSVHKGKPFYDRLIQYITSGPVVVSVLEGSEAVSRYRELMGATDPKKAARGSLRAEFATNLEENAVHGSDAQQTAQAEIALMFPELR